MNDGLSDLKVLKDYEAQIQLKLKGEYSSSERTTKPHLTNDQRGWIVDAMVRLCNSGWLQIPELQNEIFALMLGFKADFERSRQKKFQILKPNRKLNFWWKLVGARKGTGFEKGLLSTIRHENFPGDDGKSFDTPSRLHDALMRRELQAIRWVMTCVDLDATPLQDVPSTEHLVFIAELGKEVVLSQVKLPELDTSSVNWMPAPEVAEKLGYNPKSLAAYRTPAKRQADNICERGMRFRKNPDNRRIFYWRADVDAILNS